MHNKDEQKNIVWGPRAGIIERNGVGVLRPRFRRFRKCRNRSERGPGRFRARSPDRPGRGPGRYASGRGPGPAARLQERFKKRSGPAGVPAPKIPGRFRTRTRSGYAAPKLAKTKTAQDGLTGLLGRLAFFLTSRITDKSLTKYIEKHAVRISLTADITMNVSALLLSI